MASTEDLAQRLGVTRGKLAAIGVLAFVLVGVLYLQYGRDYEEQGAQSREERAEGSEGETIAANGGAKTVGADGEITPVDDEIERRNSASNDSLSKKNWIATRLASVIQYDPFALPSKFPRPPLMAASDQGDSEESIAAQEQLTNVVEELQMKLEELRQRGVHVIVRERNGYVAMIGDRTVHVGDDINGFTVTAIEPDGVHVERKIQE